MAVIKKRLYPVLEKFPDHKDEVNRLFRDSETFQAICEDYLRCEKALRYWRRVESEEVLIRREEYADLLQELELEIRQYLNQRS